MSNKLKAYESLLRLVTRDWTPELKERYELMLDEVAQEGNELSTIVDAIKSNSAARDLFESEIKKRISIND